MLYIKIAHKTYEWELDSGEQFPIRYADTATEVQCITADGKELIGILKEIDNIPKGLRHVVHTWYGDHAKFIAAYLANYYREENFWIGK